MPALHRGSQALSRGRGRWRGSSAERERWIWATGCSRVTRQLLQWNDDFRRTDRSGEGDRRRRRRQPSPPQHRNHRACGPRQDHLGRRVVASERGIPRERAGRGTGSRQHRPRARAWDHDHGQEHGHPVSGHHYQYRRHARARRFRWRGGTHADDGRWCAATGRCLRGAAATDPLRVAQGARAGAGDDRRHQQDRPAGRASRRSARRDL